MNTERGKVIQDARAHLRVVRTEQPEPVERLQPPKGISKAAERRARKNRSMEELYREMDELAEEVARDLAESAAELQARKLPGRVRTDWTNPVYRETYRAEMQASRDAQAGLHLRPGYRSPVRRRPRP